MTTEVDRRPSALDTVRIGVPMMDDQFPSEPAQGVVTFASDSSTAEILEGHLRPGFVVAAGRMSYFTVQGPAGQGSSSFVYHVKRLGTKASYALKLIPMLDLLPARGYAEVKLLQSLNHPNIVEAHRHFTVELQGLLFLGVQLEYCAKGSLADFIEQQQLRRTKQLSTSTLCSLACQTTAALQYLHGKGMIHGDLRPESILLTDEMHVKLASFSLPTIPCAFDGTVTVTGGSRWYAPPEWVHSFMREWGTAPADLPSSAYDMWSLGCVVAELLTLRRLQEQFSQSDTLAINEIARRGLIHDAAQVHHGCADALLAGLLCREPESRLAAADAAALIGCPKPHPLAQLLQRPLQLLHRSSSYD